MNQALRCRIHRIHFEVGAAVDHDLIADLLQELALLLENHVFATGVPVAVMDNKYFHRV